MNIYNKKYICICDTIKWKNITRTVKYNKVKYDI